MWSYSHLKCMGEVDFSLPLLCAFHPVSNLPSLAAQVGKPVAMCTDGSWADFNSFSQFNHWLSQGAAPKPLGTQVKASQNVWHFVSFPLHPPLAPEWQWSKLQMELLLFCQMIAINRVLVFEFGALWCRNPFWDLITHYIILPSQGGSSSLHTKFGFVTWMTELPQVLRWRWWLKAVALEWGNLG